MPDPGWKTAVFSLGWAVLVRKMLGVWIWDRVSARVGTDPSPVHIVTVLEAWWRAGGNRDTEEQEITGYGED